MRRFAVSAGRRPEQVRRPFLRVHGALACLTRSERRWPVPPLAAHDLRNPAGISWKRAAASPRRHRLELREGGLLAEMPMPAAAGDCATGLRTDEHAAAEPRSEPSSRMAATAFSLAVGRSHRSIIDNLSTHGYKRPLVLRLVWLDGFTWPAARFWPGKTRLSQRCPAALSTCEPGVHGPRLPPRSPLRHRRRS